jgi:flagellar FliL protein
VSTADATPKAAESTESAAPQKGGGAKTMIFAAVAAVVGVALGAMVIAPKLVGGKAKAPEAAAEEKKKGEEGAKAESRLVKIENVVVNPAGSEGLRFLMASVAFEVNSAEIEGELRAAEVELRDAVTGVFEKQTMAQLTRVGARDSLRSELAAVVKPMIHGKPVRVFLPQFVIQ